MLLEWDTNGGGVGWIAFTRLMIPSETCSVSLVHIYLEELYIMPVEEALFLPKWIRRCSYSLLRVL